MEKITPDHLICQTIADLFCTHPDADKHPYAATYLLQLVNGNWLALASGSILQVDATAANSVQLYGHRLSHRLRGRTILTAFSCRSTGYDQTFITVAGPMRIANCTIASERILFLRDTFDESYERDVEYWDYFTGTPVDYLGNPRPGSHRTPFRVSWE